MNCERTAIFALFACLQCVKLHVAAPLPYDPSFPDPGPDAPSARIEFVGERAFDNEFAEALTFYRIFSNSLENETGSPAEILRPALGEILRRRGYRTGDDFTLRVELDAFRMVWIPPREFIETPVPRKTGTVASDIGIRVFLTGETEDFAPPIHVHIDRQRVEALPGQEDEFMNLLANQSLARFLRELPEKIPEF